MNLLRTLVPAPLRPAARRARSFVRGLRPVIHPAPLPAADCRAAVRVARAVPPAEAGRPFEAALSVTNHTPAVIAPGGRHPVGVTVSWRSYLGELCGVPDAFVPLPRPAWPGEEIAHPFRFTAPESLGDYVAEFAVVQRGGPAFERVGGRAKLDVAVTHPLDGEFNYHDIYARADLGQDFWSVSGPGSRAEFDRLTPIKLKLLTDLGLTPDSRLLDVGCGTGLLATAAEGFLSDRGLYYGTDLAPEAVEFCKGRYRRPNFHFVTSGMTTVPVAGVEFDVVAFYSVFTHTYPDETALLLAEANRLLAPGGVIFADLFTSPLVARHAGSRYAVETNRDHVLRLIALAGLDAELVMTSPWNGQARREFFKFTRRG
ncbi:MAG: class SAM-dependent methyltransferase [Gemmataceae bacterium]|nr:class SAM-dependent methyltransferase [Gemmataceae bacterium]